MLRRSQRPRTSAAAMLGSRDTGLLAATAAGAASSRIVELPNELLLLVARLLLDGGSPQALMRLSRTAVQVFKRLQPALSEADARRLRWRQDISRGCSVSSSGFTITYLEKARSEGQCAVLPSRGVSSWVVRIEHTHDNDGCVLVGLCDEPGRNSWAFIPFSGYIFRYVDGINLLLCPPPLGFPDGNQTKVCDPQNTNTNGMRLQAWWDADEGVFSIAIDGRQPKTVALRGFPSGAAMRPWVYFPTRSKVGDTVTVKGWV